MSITTTALCWRSLRCEGMGCSHCCRTAAGGPIGQRLGPAAMPARSRSEARARPRRWNYTRSAGSPASAPPRHAARHRARRARPRARPRDCRGDLVEIRRRELERRGADPAVHLPGRASTDDRPRHARPCECPCHRYGRNRGAVPPRDRLQRVSQCEIVAQIRLLELHGATPPVVLRERGDTGGREAVRQEARLHRAVHDHAGVVPGTPPNLVSRGLAPDQEIRWCAGHDTGVIVYSPMQAGLLTDSFTAARVSALAQDDWRRRAVEFQEPNLSRNLALRDALQPIARRHGATVSAIAVAWTLAWPGVTGASVGARTAGQVDGWIGAATLELTEADLDEIAAAIARTGAGTGPTRPVASRVAGRR